MSTGQNGNNNQAKVLVVDDEATALKNLRRVLEKAGHQVATYSNPVRALERLAEDRFDLLVSDLKMPYLDGLELLDQAKRLHPEMEVILVSGFASLEGAVEATKKGAFHFLAKPFTPDELRRKVAQALEQRRLRLQAKRAVADTGRNAGVILGDSPHIRRVAETISQIAPTDCNVLIYGESGTGKELAAREIHAQSGRAAGPWVAFNCAALNRDLMDNELFGHEKGAYTGAQEAKAGLLEAADGGTLFLDEIGEMPGAMQVKLLRALQEREVLRVGATKPLPIDIRVVAATGRDLRAEVEAGTFRRDLFYRLNVVSLSLPRLADRGRDVLLLAHHFLERFNRRMGKRVRGFSPEALELVQSYAFPGNVRELMNIVERAVALCRGDTIQPADLPQDLAQLELANFSKPAGSPLTLEEMERAYIEHVLDLAGGVRVRAAQILGIDRVSLWRKLKKYDLA